MLSKRKVFTTYMLCLEKSAVVSICSLTTLNSSRYPHTRFLLAFVLEGFRNQIVPFLHVILDNKRPMPAGPTPSIPELPVLLSAEDGCSWPWLSVGISVEPIVRRPVS